MGTERSAAERAAENYYDNVDADRFHEAIWGEDEVHIGLYGRNPAAIDIADACHRATVAMADRLLSLDATGRILDLGAGYGGAARYLAQRFGCKVLCVNISEVQNERNRRRNRGMNLHDSIDVLHGSSLDIPAEEASVDVVWAQDVFVYASGREHLVAEIDRVLKPGGQVLFTDPMQADMLAPETLAPLCERFKFEAMASPLWYRREFARKGFEQLEWCELTPELLQHYTAVRSALRQRYERLSQRISTAFMDRMLVNLDNWVSAAHAGYLRWGIFHFRKPLRAS